MSLEGVVDSCAREGGEMDYHLTLTVKGWYKCRNTSAGALVTCTHLRMNHENVDTNTFLVAAHTISKYGFSRD